MNPEELIDQAQRELEVLRDAPDCVETFNALEVTLKDLARAAHAEAADRAQSHQ